MKKFGKKIMALAMASVMMCSSVTVFAADVTDESAATGSSEGSGKLEGYVDTDVFCVVLPTEATDNTTFGFTMDPQHLLNKTAQTGYGATDTVFFANAGSTFSGTSDVLTAQNKGTVKVDVSVTATASNLGTDDVTIPLTTDKTFADDETTSLYLGLIMGSDAAIPLDATSLSATATATMDAVPDGSYEFKKVGDEYKYVLKDSVTTFPDATFKLEGACNENGNKDAWLAVNDAAIAPSVTVAWTLQKHGPRAAITTGGKITVSGIPAGVSVDLTKSTFHGSKLTTPYLVSTYTSTDDSGYTEAAGGTVIYQFTDTAMGYYVGQILTVDIVLSDGTTLSATTLEEPKVTATSNGTVTVSNLPAGVSVDLANSSLCGADGKSYALTTYTTTDESGYSTENGGTIIYQMIDTSRNYYRGYPVTFTITLSNGKTLTAKATIQ